LHAPGVPSVAFDWDQLGSYLPALQGVDRLFLLTPNSERQVGSILQAVAAARRAGVTHIARVSVMGADAESGIILGRQHVAAEREIRASGTGWTMLRPARCQVGNQAICTTQNISIPIGMPPGASVTPEAFDALLRGENPLLGRQQFRHARHGGIGRPSWRECGGDRPGAV
jgi:uncharacterized protein YbjT (DUF2867 family)